MLLPTRIDVGTTFGEQLVDYRCTRCGFAAVAGVTGSGTALRVSGVAVSDAGLDARVGAASAAALAPCPRCGHRSRAALAKVLLLGASIGAIAAMAAGFAAAEQLHASDPDGRIGWAVGLATFVAVVVATTAAKLRSVRRRVRLYRAAA